MNPADFLDLLECTVDCVALERMCSERRVMEIGTVILEAYDRALHDADAEAAERSDIEYDRKVDDQLTEAA